MPLVFVTFEITHHWNLTDTLLGRSSLMNAIGLCTVMLLPNRSIYGHRSHSVQFFLRSANTTSICKLRQFISSSQTDLRQHLVEFPTMEVYIRTGLELLSKSTPSASINMVLGVDLMGMLCSPYNID